MKFSEIAIGDKELFDNYLKLYNPQISELTFTNLFMWRKKYRFRYAEINGYLCLISVPEDSSPYALPLIGRYDNESFGRTVLLIKEYFIEKGWEPLFRKVPEEELEHFRQYADRDKGMVFDRDNSDYVYSCEELINLKGNKFHAKRNHINKLKKKYSFGYVELDASLLDECYRIMYDWCAQRNCDCMMGEYCERYANIELLDNYSALGCKGALIKVDHSFEAFTVGEKLNGDTAVIHIEKASFSIDGLYSLINQQFCENQWNDTGFINREQDLGVEGLRKSKLSYNPVKMINKYTVHLAT